MQSSGTDIDQYYHEPRRREKREKKNISRSWLLANNKFQGQNYSRERDVQMMMGFSKGTSSPEALVGW